MTNLVSPIPAEIIEEEILMRLPVKSVVRFRSVCKLWNTLFSDPSFMQNHFDRNGFISHKEEEEDDYIILSKYVWARGSCRRRLAIISNHNFLESNINKPPYSSLVENKIYLVGSINGLVCLADYKSYEFILWNPAIHWFNKISIPPVDRRQICRLYMFGFGWDSSANDYKLIASASYKAACYSCNVDNWSKQKAVDFSVSHYELFPCVIVRGIPYWKSMTHDPNRLLKFDVTTNEFNVLDIVHVRGEYSLINLNDRLAYVEYGNSSNDHLEYGFERGGAYVYCFDEQNSKWSKIYTIDGTTVGKPVSMCFKYGGEFVFDGMNNLYDPKSKEIKSLRRNHRHEETLYSFHGFSYTPSMFALQGMKPLKTSMSSRMLFGSRI